MAGTGKGPTPRQRLFGDRVRSQRQGLGLSQEALADRSGIARAYVGSLEAGERNPSLETVARLAKALEVDAGDLVSGIQDLAGRT
ncbi:MAG: helix-turn-helix domain-containing protein [Actinomycetota bacterium]|nr:helix-turn-helix domain-containing protein [Actinomycetota bacterium]